MARIAGVRGACVSLLGFHPGCGMDAQNLVVAMAGPVLNLVSAICGAFSYYEHGISLAGWFAMANAILGIHNLLPVPHSDGARVVELVRRMKDSAVTTLPFAIRLVRAEGLPAGSCFRGTQQTAT